ncbi:MAG: response regulator transcription factor [Chloroflexi bacterium]|nr:response regulator transcription factor [Chloroflexota bacterium]
MADGIKVLVAGEQVLMCEGMRSLLKAYDEIEVVGEASDGRQAVETTRSLQPDVVVIDCGMKVLDGFEVTRRLLREAPRTRVIILTNGDVKDTLSATFMSGAYGCIPKTATSLDVASAIKAVHAGRMYLHSSLTETLLQEYVSLRKTQVPADPYERLTRRERHVLRLMVDGLTSRQIALQLGIAVKTAVGHRAKLMGKLDVHNQAQLIRYALQRQLVDSALEK